MAKLSEMTIGELWALFPIFLVAYKKEWQDYYQEEKVILLGTIKPVSYLRIAHIGSTAVKGIYAKNIVDILLEVEQDDFMLCLSKLKNEGYILMDQQSNRASFNKGYSEQGFLEKVYHIHLRVKGDHDELYFRDYLLEHEDVARRYEALKLSLWKMFEHDRDGYTNAKRDFILDITKKAKEIYQNRYE